MLWIELAPMAIAMPAITSPLEIHGNKSLSLCMSQLSLRQSGAYRLWAQINPGAAAVRM
jgi:hypothetical protein